MEVPASSSHATTLPLKWRLRRALLIALLLGLWAPAKIIWERHIAVEQDELRYHGAVVTRQLRDQLGQGLSIGVLAGMRSVVADMVWLNMVVAWMDQQWFKMDAYINLCTALQPRAPVFWDIGGWHLAWNASISARTDRTQPNDLRRIKASRFWIDRGLEIYLRGIENNPGYWRLWRDAGMLYDQRLHDFKTAAWYYQKASDLPDAPVFLERAPAEMYDAHHQNDPQSEYAEWVKLWNKLTPEEKTQKVHTPQRIETELRRLEAKLSIPREKRIFPN